jgi:hypothetical protein
MMILRRRKTELEQPTPAKGIEGNRKFNFKLRPVYFLVRCFV